MKEIYPKPVYVDDGKQTFQDADGSLWPVRFKRALDFREGLAAIELGFHKWTFIDKDRNMWSERFIYVADDFHEGFAVVQPDYGSGYKFVDKDHNFWPEKFGNYTQSFREGLAVVHIYKYEENAFTFVDKNRNFWPERFSYAMSFSDGLAPVKLEDGWTFVDKNHNFWPERFKSAESFCRGLALVELEDGWTFVDKDHKFWPERFKYHPSIQYYGLYKVYNTGRKDEIYVDREHRFYSKKEAEALEKIHINPELFLELPTESFKDENFIQGAIFQVKNALINPILRQETVDDEYEKACLELLENCKEKTQKERQIIEQRQKENAKKEKMINSIKEFNL